MISNSNKKKYSDRLPNELKEEYSKLRNQKIKVELEAGKEQSISFAEYITEQFGLKFHHFIERLSTVIVDIDEIGKIGAIQKKKIQEALSVNGKEDKIKEERISAFLYEIADNKNLFDDLKKFCEKLLLQAPKMTEEEQSYYNKLSNELKQKYSDLRECVIKTKNYPKGINIAKYIKDNFYVDFRYFVEAIKENFDEIDKLPDNKTKIGVIDNKLTGSFFKKVYKDQKKINIKEFLLPNLVDEKNKYLFNNLKLFVEEMLEEENKKESELDGQDIKYIYDNLGFFDEKKEKPKSEVNEGIIYGTGTTERKLLEDKKKLRFTKSAQEKIAGRYRGLCMFNRAARFEHLLHLELEKEKKRTKNEEPKISVARIKELANKSKESLWVWGPWEN